MSHCARVTAVWSNQSPTISTAFKVLLSETGKESRNGFCKHAEVSGHHGIRTVTQRDPLRSRLIDDIYSLFEASQLASPMLSGGQYSTLSPWRKHASLAETGYPIGHPRLSLSANRTFTLPVCLMLVSFMSILFGATDNPQAVSASLPTWASVVGWSQKNKALLNSFDYCYPR